MRIGVDLDGVLADFDGGFAQLLSDITGNPIPYGGENTPPVWDWPLLHAKPAEVETAWNIVEESPDFWARLRRLPDADQAIDLLQQLIIDHHHVYFITSRPGATALYQSADWLATELGIYYPNVMISTKKGIVAQGLELQALIDDRPENFAALPTSCRGYLVTRSHNLWVPPDASHLTRVSTCAEALRDVIERFS